MTLPKGAEAYAEKHGKDDNDKKRLKDAFYAGYYLSTDNWCNKARD